MSELSRLDPLKILSTAELLARRVHERFPDSGLSRVSQELITLASHAKETSEWIERPNMKLRALSVVVVTLMLAASIFAVVASVRIGHQRSTFGLPELVQVSEAAVNDVVLLGAAIFFLFSVERRAKRAKVFQAVQQLRTLAHLVDVHQLTKNPDALEAGYAATESSPVRRMTPFQLQRYLDYCTEMLSIIGKIAALYCDGFDDEEAVEAVTDLEQMTIGLQRKIWQKIAILERNADAD
ncbi:MAG: hypothetical protein KC593_17960 [Myxococcales bacterium]|nr:hypothetical protein [Myxococcales bacterium]MCB9629294.1 hypothetical protein [Sandaracinaceae bacterium]